jgi:hypothetical protein
MLLRPWIEVAQDEETAREHVRNCLRRLRWAGRGRAIRSRRWHDRCATDTPVQYRSMTTSTRRHRPKTPFRSRTTSTGRGPPKIRFGSMAGDSGHDRLRLRSPSLAPPGRSRVSKNGRRALPNDTSSAPAALAWGSRLRLSLAGLLRLRGGGLWRAGHLLRARHARRRSLPMSAFGTG